MAVVFFYDMNQPADDVSALYSKLPVGVKEHFPAVLYSHQQLLSIYGKALLLDMTNELLQLQTSLNDIYYNSWGKPLLPSDLQFNIAHSGSIVICAGIVDGVIGADIELIKDVNINLLREHFTTGEWSEINSPGNVIAAFYRMWTRKEALIKAVGKGVLLPLQEIDVRGDYVSYEGKTYYLYDVFIQEDYASCIAVSKPTDNIEIRKIEY